MYSKIFLFNGIKMKMMPQKKNIYSLGLHTSSNLALFAKKKKRFGHLWHKRLLRYAKEGVIWVLRHQRQKTPWRERPWELRNSEKKRLLRSRIVTKYCWCGGLVSACQKIITYFKSTQSFCKISEETRCPPRSAFLYSGRLRSLGAQGKNHMGPSAVAVVIIY